MKRALITGLTGQDGSYLAELLLSRGYEVHGVVRPSTTRVGLGNAAGIAEHPRLRIHQADLAVPATVVDIMKGVHPDEVYNLAGQSHVTTSFELPDYTTIVNSYVVVAMLDAIREMGVRPRFYQASSSEIFGGMPGTEPQSEKTPLYPRSPYAVAKATAFWAVRNYREAYELHASNGILFNHESPRRGEGFVTRKIAIAAARIARGLQERLVLGTLTPLRDWGYAPEYVEAMTRMLAKPEPGDYVIATGAAYSVQNFVDYAFLAAGVPLTWRGGAAEDARGIRRVEVDPALARPSEVMVLRGDPSHALINLYWRAETRAPDLAKLMVAHELERLR